MSFLPLRPHRFCDPLGLVPDGYRCLILRAQSGRGMQTSTDSVNKREEVCFQFRTCTSSLVAHLLERHKTAGHRVMVPAEGSKHRQTTGTAKTKPPPTRAGGTC